MQPDQIVLRDSGQTLIIDWPTGRSDSLSAARLWTDCPSSRARRQRIDGEERAAPAGLRITGVAPIGLYAVNIAFSDGHDRGIYPWSFLDRLGARLHAAPDGHETPLKAQGDQQ
jgi:DUF971 family protein